MISHHMLLNSLWERDGLAYRVFHIAYKDFNVEKIYLNDGSMRSLEDIIAQYPDMKDMWNLCIPTVKHTRDQLLTLNLSDNYAHHLHVLCERNEDFELLEKYYGLDLFLSILAKEKLFPSFKERLSAYIEFHKKDRFVDMQRYTRVYHVSSKSFIQNTGEIKWDLLSEDDILTFENISALSYPEDYSYIKHLRLQTLRCSDVYQPEFFLHFLPDHVVKIDKKIDEKVIDFYINNPDIAQKVFDDDEKRKSLLLTFNKLKVGDGNRKRLASICNVWGLEDVNSLLDAYDAFVLNHHLNIKTSFYSIYMNSKRLAHVVTEYDIM